MYKLHLRQYCEGVLDQKLSCVDKYSFISGNTEKCAASNIHPCPPLQGGMLDVWHT